MKVFAGIIQRICRNFKTRKQEILNRYFTKPIDLYFISPLKLLALSLNCFFSSVKQPGRLCNKLTY